MKKVILFITTIMILACASHAQNDTMYTYKSGVVVAKRALNDIDSVIFYKPIISQTSTVTDIDGNVYDTITIGAQTWLVQNLKTTRYNNGDTIGTTDPPTKDLWTESSPKYEWAYGGDNSNVPVYGRLYTWYVITDSRGVCPVGWHVPTDTEWTTLFTYLGGAGVAGGKLKETGISHWNTPNTDATNLSGFTGLPGGIRNIAGYFYNLNSIGYYWSITEANADYAWYRLLYCNTGTADVMSQWKHSGFSVRCLKN